MTYIFQPAASYTSHFGNKAIDTCQHCFTSQFLVGAPFWRALYLLYGYTTDPHARSDNFNKIINFAGKYNNLFRNVSVLRKVGLVLVQLLSLKMGVKDETNVSARFDGQSETSYAS